MNTGKLQNSLANTSVSPGTVTGNMAPVGGVGAGQALAGVMTDIRNLSPGQTFSGQITDIRNGSVTVNVKGQTFQAKFESSADVVMGEVLNFVVRENNGEKVFIAPMKKVYGTFIDVALYKALQAAGLPATDKNIDVIAELLKNQMSVEKKSIQQILSYSYQFPEATLEDLILLVRHHIPVKQENLEQLGSLKNQEHTLVSDIKGLMDRLPEVLANLPDSIGKEETLALLKEMGILSESDTPAMSHLNGENVGKAGQEQNSKLASELLDPRKSAEELKQLLSGDTGRAFVSDRLLRQWTLEPAQLDSAHLSQVYAKLNRHMQTVQDKLDTSEQTTESVEGGKGGPGNQSVMTAARNVQNNLEFMNEINKDFIFAQLPIKLKEQVTHGELYVFSNKKSGSGGKDGLKVLLHLDMEHLGSTDILIQLKGKTLRLKFSLEEERSTALLKENFERLRDQLTEKGFLVLPEFVKKEEEFDFAEDFLKQDNTRRTDITRYSFDMRA